jgi:hypothetical protein
MYLTFGAWPKHCQNATRPNLAFVRRARACCTRARTRARCRPSTPRHVVGWRVIETVPRRVGRRVAFSTSIWPRAASTQCLIRAPCVVRVRLGKGNATHIPFADSGESAVPRRPGLGEVTYSTGASLAVRPPSPDKQPRAVTRRSCPARVVSPSPVSRSVP